MLLCFIGLQRTQHCLFPLPFASLSVLIFALFFPPRRRKDARYGRPFLPSLSDLDCFRRNHLLVDACPAGLLLEWLVPSAPCCAPMVVRPVPSLPTSIPTCCGFAFQFESPSSCLPIAPTSFFPDCGFLDLFALPQAAEFARIGLYSSIFLPFVSNPHGKGTCLLFCPSCLR